MRFRRERYCNCAECPLKGRNRVFGLGPKDPEICFVGEAPGKQEDQIGDPFVGPAGKWLNAALGKAGIFRDNVWLTNVICCRPTNNQIDTLEALEAIKCCQPGFTKEIMWLLSKGVKVISPLGNTALTSLRIPDKITKARGSVYERYLSNDRIYESKKLKAHKFLIIPTFHPSYIMRGKLKEEVTWQADLNKIKDICRDGYTTPREDFNMFPKVKDIETFVAEAVDKEQLIAVDIETTNLKPWSSEIVVVGLAKSGSKAISVPFLKQCGAQYWSTKDRTKVEGLLKLLFSKVPTVFQNAMFDVAHLEWNGFEVKNITHDIMLLHHAIHPELPHNLGYIVSVYGKTPYWKDIVFKEGGILRASDDSARRYNLRDCVVLHQVLPEMLKDLKEIGTEKTYYDVSMKLIRPVMSMTSNGIKISQHRLNTWRKALENEYREIEQKVRSLCGLPDSFNLDSPDHIRLLVYGEESNQFTKAKEELKKYDVPGTTRKKNTKKYRDLVSKARVLDSVKPLQTKKSTVSKTEKGNTRFDEEVVTRLQVFVSNELERLSKLKTPKPDEEREYIKLRDFLKMYLRYKELGTLISRYTSYPVGPDKRVHFNFKIHGTATGRLSSGSKRSDPNDPGNMQNIPKEARKLFVAEKNHKIMYADYTNLELVVLAYVSEDEPAIKAFKEGINFHDMNTTDLFGLTKEDETWEAARKATKIYRFARNYGGSLKGVYDRVNAQVPELGLTFNKFKEVDLKYRKLHPNYAKWYDKTVRQVLATRKLENAFGRVRFFLGQDHAIEREGANFPIQSGAADIINDATIRIFDELPDGVKLLGQVHDALLFEVPNGKVKSFSRLVKKHMEYPRKIGKYTVSFPVEIEVGDDWLNMEKLND